MEETELSRIQMVRDENGTWIHLDDLYQFLRRVGKDTGPIPALYIESIIVLLQNADRQGN